MRVWFLMVVLVMAAGCKAKHKPLAKVTADAAPPRVDVVVRDLAQVGADAPLAPVSDPIPAKVLLLDSAGNFALVGAPKSLDAIVMHQRTAGPGTIEDLTDLGNSVHAEMQDKDDEEITAREMKAEEENPTEPGTIVEPKPQAYGRVPVRTTFRTRRLTRSAMACLSSTACPFAWRG